MTYTNKFDLYRNQIFRWRKIKQKAIEYKGGCCSHCGFNTHPAALQFHHINPEEKDVSWNKLRLRSWHKIVIELDNCLLLCANCHVILHAKSKYD